MLLTPYILAGGQSTRMGRDKAFVLVEGATLLHHALRRAESLGTARILSGSASDSERRAQLQKYAPTVPDRTPNAGPLGGIDAALQDSPTEWLLVLPIDQPYVPASALTEWVAEVERTGGQAAWFTHPGGEEPLPLMLHRSLAAPIAAALLQGQRRILPAVQAAAARVHVAFRPQSHWFLNLNSPADLDPAKVLDSR